MLSDADLYSSYRSMQEHDTDRLMNAVVKTRMDWSRQDGDIVMDVGCGPGDSVLRDFLPAFPRVKKIVGVDVLPEMIEAAKKKTSGDDRLEFHVANVEDRSTMERWHQQITKVISIYCFNWVGDQKEAFHNIYHVLKPGGEAVLLWVITTPFWDSFVLHYENPKYSKYLQNINPHVPDSHFKKYGASYYRQLLDEVGFNVIVCEEERRAFAYPNDDICRAAAFSRSALTSHIPEDLRAKFKEDLFQGFLKFNGRNSDGKPVLDYTTLTLLIRKPSV